MHAMRRKDRQISKPEDLLSILQACQVCRLGFYDQGQIYIVPLNFGFSQRGGRLTLYFHSAMAGRKADLVRRGGQVGFELDCAHQVVLGTGRACDSTMLYQSIIGTGLLRVVDPGQAREALRTIMAHYTDQQPRFGEEAVKCTLVFAVDVEEISGKANQPRDIETPPPSAEAGHSSLSFT